MNSKKLIPIFSLIFFIFLFISPIAQASTVYWWNSLESNSEWTVTQWHHGTLTNDTQHDEGNYSQDLSITGDSIYFSQIEATHTITGFPDLTSYSYWVRFWVYCRQIGRTSQSGGFQEKPMILFTNDIGVGFRKNSTGFVFELTRNIVIYPVSVPYIATSTNTSGTVRSLSTWYYIDCYTSPTHSELWVNGTLDIFDNQSRSNQKPTTLTLLSSMEFSYTNEFLFDYVSFSDTKGEEGTGTPPVNPPPNTPTGTWGIDITLLPSRLALVLGIDAFTSGILISCFVVLFFLLPTIIFTDNIYAILTMVILSMTLCVALTWLPVWTLFVIVLMIALLFAGSARDWIIGQGAK